MSNNLFNYGLGVYNSGSLVPNISCASAPAINMCQMSPVQQAQWVMSRTAPTAMAGIEKKLSPVEQQVPQNGIGVW